MQITDVHRPSNRISGLLGALGALLLFVGDLLLYGHWGSGADFRNGMSATVVQASLVRLFAGGLLGIPGACLGLFGCWHVSQNVSVQSPRASRVVFLAHSAMMVAIGAVHVLWVPRGLALKYAAQASSSAPELLTALRDYWVAADVFAQGPGYLAAILMFGLVLLGRTPYSRWTALANPGVLIVGVEPLAHHCPAPVGAALVGGFSNVALTVFFLVSVASTWSRPEASP